MTDVHPWELDQPGRDRSVGHPDYVKPDSEPKDSESGSLDHLSLTAKRLKVHGPDGLSAPEIAAAQAEIASHE